MYNMGYPPYPPQAGVVYIPVPAPQGSTPKTIKEQYEELDAIVKYVEDRKKSIKEAEKKPDPKSINWKSLSLFLMATLPISGFLALNFCAVLLKITMENLQAVIK